MRIWFDVEDLFAHGAGYRRPTGIQRLAFEVQKAMRARAGANTVRFLRHHRGHFFEVAWTEVEALFEGIAAHAPSPSSGIDRATRVAGSPTHIALRNLLYRLPPRLRIALIAAGRAQLAALRSQVEVLRRLSDIPRALFRHRPKTIGQRPLVPLSDLAARGDVLAVLGAPWGVSHYAEMLADVRKRLGMKVLVLVHDLIPVRHPEWCDPRHVWHFTNWIETTLPETDIVLANSNASARDVEAYADRRGIALAHPVSPIPIGTGFGIAASLHTVTDPRPPHLPPPSCRCRGLMCPLIPPLTRRTPCCSLSPAQT